MTIHRSNLTEEDEADLIRWANDGGQNLDYGEDRCSRVANTVREQGNSLDQNNVLPAPKKRK